MITFFHKDMQGTFQYYGSSSDLFPIKTGESKPACSLQLSSASFPRRCCPSLSASRRTECIFTTESMVVSSTWPASYQNQSATVSQTQMLFEVDSALTAHSEKALRGLANCFAHGCSARLDCQPKGDQHYSRDICSTPVISTGSFALGVVEYRSRTSAQPSPATSLDTEGNKRIGIATKAMARLAMRV